MSQELTAVQINAKVFAPAGGRYRRLDISFQSRWEPAACKVSIFDLSGRRMVVLPVSGPGPEFSASWDGQTASGQAAPAGIYVYEIKAGNAAYQGAVVLAR